MSEATADVGLVGLAVMGQNLALNLAEHGHRVAVYNRTRSVTDEFVGGVASDAAIVGCADADALIASLTSPRRIIVMVRAGAATDAVLDDLAARLDPGDILIDCGNAHFPDTVRRQAALAERGVRFVGSGVSGGEEGARHGPSIMPGGDPAAWPALEAMLKSIAADVDGEPCCEWIGPGGAGHYVKMVHNGIEYGDMQLIAEAYDVLHRGLGLGHDEMASIFDEWNRGDLDSYLVEITAAILAHEDADGGPLLERILDTAGQKGTGKWTGISALELGMPVSLIGEAVFARCLSAMKAQRARAARVLAGPDGRIDGAAREGLVADLGRALYAAKIVSYAQGFLLLQEASREHRWDLDFGSIASLWRGGCIIRSRFLNHIRAAYEAEPGLESLLVADYFQAVLAAAEPSWRRVVSAGVLAGLPLPAMGAGLAFYDGYRSERLPANMLQAQRDYFGAHTYERVDAARGEFFHTDWTGTGGPVSSRTYSV